MKIKQTLILFALLISFGSFFISPTVSAGTCAGVETAFFDCPENDRTDPTKTGIWYLLLIAINILTAGVGIAAIGGIVVGSIMYTTAGGKPEQVKKANMILINTIFGIVIYALFYSFLNFLIPGGLFNTTTTPPAPSSPTTTPTTDTRPAEPTSWNLNIDAGKSRL